MAQATGYTCDQCKKFEAAPSGTGKQLPPGWMMLVVNVTNGHENAFDLCSNKCVRLKATDREKAEREFTVNPPEVTVALAKVMTNVHGEQPVKNGRGANVDSSKAVYMNHKRHHSNKGFINPDCYFCDLETSS